MDAFVSALIGFTTKEVRDNFIDVISVYCEEDYIEEELKDLKFHYNGYKFNNSVTENRVYSPVSIIKHLTSMLKIFMEIKEKKNQKNKGTLNLIYSSFNL